jgi:hypothetical protein
LVETKTKAARIRPKLRCLAEIKDLTAVLKEELRGLYDVVGQHFAQFLDMKQSFDS